MTTGRLLVALLAVMFAMGWLMRDELKRRLMTPDPVRQRVYTWTDAEGNVHYGDRSGGAQGKTVIVDTSRITPLEPLPSKEAAFTAGASAPPAHGAADIPASGQARGVGDNLDLRELGREMQEAQKKVRERQMNQVMDGESSPSR